MALVDEHWSVRYAAAEALGRIGDARAVEALVAALTDQDTGVRPAVAGALDRIDANWRKCEAAQQAVPTLLAALTDQDAHVRSAAAQALKKIDPKLAETKVGHGVATPLDAVLIIFSKEFSPKDKFINSILEKMQARGRPYKDWISENTPVRIIVSPNVKDPVSFIPRAIVAFRPIVPLFSVDRIEYAPFEGSEGISGVIVTHWSS